MAEQTCQGVPSFPDWAGSSVWYRQQFNKVALEEGLPFLYFNDNPQGSSNVPEDSLGELFIVDQEKWKKYQENPEFKSILARDICQVRQTVETRRLEMTRVGVGVYPVVQSATYQENKLNTLNKGEQAWVQAVVEKLYQATQALYAIQAYARSGQTLAWMRANADPVSLFHYERIRGAKKMPSKPVEGIPDSESYASILPWFQDTPSFSRMWPADLSKAELATINKEYAETDPIRLPYTRVYRVTREQACAIQEKPKQNSRGVPVEWVRKGLGDRWYRVVNMAFDEEMRPHFLAIAQVLEKNAQIKVEGQGLDPQFRAFTQTMASAFREGDFEGLLRKDLQLSEGNLFMTFYPHEGYWEDGIKFPLMFEVGIRDEGLLAQARKMQDTIGWLGKQVEASAKQAGLTSYQAPQVDLSNLRRDVVFFWALRTGAFMRAYIRDPGGHDYPKVTIPGIDNHRVAMVLDTLKSWGPLAKAAAQLYFGDEVARYVDFEGISGFAMMHEVGHGAQIKQNAKVGNGQTFSEALGNRWGALVEPWADAGAVLTYHRALQDGLISEQEYKRAVYSSILYSFVRLKPRATALSEGYIAGGPHITGSSMYIGWLYQQGAIRKGRKGNLELVDAKIPVATERFFKELATYAAKGDREGFNAFIRRSTEYLPEKLEAELLAKKGQLPSYVLLNRGELKPPPGLTSAAGAK